MPTSILTCPHCGAALVGSRFAASAVCDYCGATVRIDPSSVSARRFHEAWETWNRPDPSGVSIGDTHWTVDRLLARGEISDVYLARRARWPTELAVLKVLRSPDQSPLLDREWQALETLHRDAAAGEMNLAMRVPYPIVRDRSSAAYRWAPGFLHTFEAVRGAYPEGIAPVASIWVWRRVLEILSVMKRNGLAHGAVMPRHLLIERGEHGVRLVGFSGAGSFGGPLSTRADVIMAARCVAYLLGGSGDDGSVPTHVPAALAELVRGAANGDAGDDPWSLRQRVGEVGQALFGPPSFHPIVME